jgi:hypothetical protein
MMILLERTNEFDQTHLFIDVIRCILCQGTQPIQSEGVTVRQQEHQEPKQKMTRKSRGARPNPGAPAPNLERPPRQVLSGRRQRGARPILERPPQTWSARPAVFCPFLLR